MSAREKYDRIFKLLKEHSEFFNRSIPLIASENVTSPAVREALTSDFGHRYAEGWPGERVYAGCRYIDEVELMALELAKEIFRAEFVDVRPISGVCANLIMYTAFTEPGDRIMALSIPTGGHISMGRKRLWGTAGAVHGLKVQYFEYDDESLNIDVDKTVKRIRRLEARGDHIKLYLFGASVFPFPHPVKEIAEVAREYDAKVAYDAAHVAGLIGAGLFQDPLREGADCVQMSTHKTFFGPQRGMIASWEKYAERLKNAAFPANLSNHHLHSLAALAVALCEFKEFGRAYAEQVIRNAQALGQALYERGFKVLGEKLGFTKSHVLLIDVVDTPLKNGRRVEMELEKAGIIVNRNLLPYDIREGRHFMEPGGIRIGTSELTRLGMKESEMVEVAEFMKRVVIDGEDPKRVARDVAEFRKGYQYCHYCFEEAAEAYKYLGLR
ncbi:serine hydroxymethyltransferase [Candidatus Bathyarchaeota archaeon]|nr:MAG: serine hydroxymethyltransferase [Candidatus Bathyarchaeota archaeon]